MALPLKIENYVPAIKQARGYYSDYPIVAPIQDDGGATYDVKNYGAVGDGSTDDTVAIQAALVAVEDAGGGTLVFGAGTYKITGVVYLKSTVRMTGAGMNKTIIKSTGHNVGMFYYQETINNPLTDFEMSEMTIDGSSVTYSAYDPAYKGVYVQYALRCKWQNLYVLGTVASGLGIDFLVDNVIDGCIVEDCGRGWVPGAVGANGIGIGTGGYEYENVIVTNCQAIGIGNNGIMFEQQINGTGEISQDMTITNCTATGCRYGFRNSGARKVTFVNCFAYENTQHGIFMDTSPVDGVTNPQDVKLISCTFNNNVHSGIVMDDDEHDAAFKNVEIIGCTISTNGSSTSDYGITGNGVSNVTIQGCHVYSNQGHGIRLATSNTNSPLNNCLVQGNTIYNNSQGNVNGTDGIRLEQTGGTGNINNCAVRNNRIYDDQTPKTQRYGLTISATNVNCTVEGNDLTGAGNSANAAFGASSTLVIRNNRGWNPIGVSAISPGASPYTYTAGNNPEDIYISGGTVSAIAKNATTLYASTDKTVHLEPNQALTVTYSSVPTMTKDVY